MVKHGEVLVVYVLLVELRLEVNKVEGWRPLLGTVEEVPYEAGQDVDVETQNKHQVYHFVHLIKCGD